MKNIKVVPFQEFIWLSKDGSYMEKMYCISVHIVNVNKVIYNVRGDKNIGTLSAIEEDEVFTDLEEVLSLSKTRIERRIERLKEYILEIENINIASVKRIGRDTLRLPIREFASYSHFLGRDDKRVEKEIT